MMNRILAVALVAAPVALAGAQLPEKTSEFRWSERIDAGRAVKIANINGSVTLRAGGGDRVEVLAIKRWRRSDPNSVRIFAARENGDIRICPLYEDKDDCNDNGRTDRRRRDRYDDRRDDDLQIDFTVTLPRGVNVDAVTVNGPLSVTGATESISATTVNGDVTVESGRGRLIATTVSGTVHATVMTAPSAMTFTSVNGDVIVDLSSSIGTDVDMTTVSGNLRSDYDLVVRSGRFNPFNMGAHLGPAGGPRMTVTTVSGNVELRKK